MTSGNGDHQPTRIIRPDGLGQPADAANPETAMDRADTRPEAVAPPPADGPERRSITPLAASSDAGAPSSPAPRPIGAPLADPAPIATSASVRAGAPPLDLGGAEVTVPHRPGGLATEPAAEAAPASPPPAAPSRSEEGAVTAWLVVVEGPGRGRAVELYYGRNTIGRSAEERITLDFGDHQISRRKAAIVIYDHMKHAFHLADGESSNAIFVNDEVLVGARVLADGDIITLGATKLLFRPLCTPSFNWEQAPTEPTGEVAAQGSTQSAAEEPSSQEADVVEAPSSPETPDAV